ncbi:hypothetical protein ACHAWF_008811 [Thalassiosira exigua]
MAAAATTTTATAVMAPDRPIHRNVGTKESDKSFQHYNVVNNFNDISERIHHKADSLFNFAYRINRSNSFLSLLSKVRHDFSHDLGELRCRLARSSVFDVKHRPIRSVFSSKSKIHPLQFRTGVQKNMASYDIFSWLAGDDQRELHETNDDHQSLCLNLLAEIHVKQPGYLNILPNKGAGSSVAEPEVNGKSTVHARPKAGTNVASHSGPMEPKGSDGERLWVTSFSMTSLRGELHSVDVQTGMMSSVDDRTARTIKWPNEVTSVPKQEYISNQARDVSHGDQLLVTDGFLVPGKDKGGLYVIDSPLNNSERNICLTGPTDWFYHRAIFVDLTGDGRQSVIAARAKRNLFGESEGQLVWLERPAPHFFDALTGAPLDKSGNPFDPFSADNLPWKSRTLAEGPDVMFSVADLDQTDDTIEVISSQFFTKKVSLHSIKLGPRPEIVFNRIIDDRCGHAFSSVLADLDGCAARKSLTQSVVVDSGSTVDTLTGGDAFSHLLVTSHECLQEEVGDDKTDSSSKQLSMASVGRGSGATSPTDTVGGSLFAYRVPAGKNAWKYEPWTRSTVATGFKVHNSVKNMISPGAPGFCYPFHPTRGGGFTMGKKWQRPLIGLSGDCAESAYILRPIEGADSIHGAIEEGVDKSTKYALMSEIKCKSTVGSLAIGYDSFCSQGNNDGFANIYVPCYEEDKVLVFGIHDNDKE